MSVRLWWKERKRRKAVELAAKVAAKQATALSAKRAEIREAKLRLTELKDKRDSASMDERFAISVKLPVLLADLRKLNTLTKP